MSEKQQIAIIGLGVMGKSLALNMLDHHISICVYDAERARGEDFLKTQTGRPVTAAFNMSDLASTLEKPRKVLLMVPAGEPVDKVLETLSPCLDQGDIIIDGGNSHFHDTERRMNLLKRQGLLYIGMGVSGGEEGARRGPCLMPGGCREAWSVTEPILTAISALLPDGIHCCRWVGPGSSGHYVKMVHNAIEYGDMQLICEAYQFLREALGLSCNEISRLFTEWGKGELDSYLVHITADILTHTESDGTPLVDRILDTASQKGTGSWAISAALELGTPFTLVSASVFARHLAAARTERLVAAQSLCGPSPALTEEERSGLTQAVRDALYASKIISYAQGFSLLAQASHAYQWSLDLRELALLWRGGCVIRSVFLDRIAAAFSHNSECFNLMLDEYFSSALKRCQNGWRQVCALSALHGIPMPATAAALAYYDSVRSPRLPANLLQAQRDYFGAHRYERTDAPAGQLFHTDWTADTQQEVDL